MKPEDLKGIVHSDPEIMGGTPVFVGTRVPLRNLIDYLDGDYRLDEFLYQRRLDAGSKFCGHPPPSATESSSRRRPGSTVPATKPLNNGSRPSPG